MMKVITLSSDDFYERFKSFAEMFENEPLITRNDIGIWITAILPHHSSAEELYCQAWDFPTYDAIHFVAYLRDKIILGEADCNLEGEEIAKYLKEILQSS
mgnify:CR=1 FL=1